MKYSFFAYHLKEKFKLRDLQKVLPFEPFQTNPDEIVYKFEKNAYIFLYKFGSIVFFNIPKDQQTREIDRITSTLELSEEITSSEEFFLETGSKSGINISAESVHCQKINFDTIYLISLILAQSVSLEYFELMVDEMLNRSRKITRNLEQKGKISPKTKELIKYIGFALTTKQAIVSKLYILDKPEITWDNPPLDKLYYQLNMAFELSERFKLLDYKFRMIQDSLEIISDLISTRKEQLLEILIIALIALEVILFVYELFFK